MIKKLETNEISKNDGELLFNALEKAKKLDHFEPIVVLPSASFNEEYSTNHKRQIKRIEREKTL